MGEVRWNFESAVSRLRRKSMSRKQVAETNVKLVPARCAFARDVWCDSLVRLGILGVECNDHPGGLPHYSPSLTQLERAIPFLMRCLISVSTLHRSRRWRSAAEHQPRHRQKLDASLCRRWRSSGGLRRCWTGRRRCGPSAAPPSPNSTPSPNPSSSTSSATLPLTRKAGRASQSARSHASSRDGPFGSNLNERALHRNRRCRNPTFRISRVGESRGRRCGIRLGATHRGIQANTVPTGRYSRWHHWRSTWTFARASNPSGFRLR